MTEEEWSRLNNALTDMERKVIKRTRSQYYGNILHPHVKDYVSIGRPRNIRFARIWAAIVLAAFAIMPFVLRWMR